MEKCFKLYIKDVTHERLIGVFDSTMINVKSLYHCVDNQENSFTLTFEDDTLVARPLLSVAEIHAEAEQQHNCLERLYLDKIAEGYTNVVAVRRKKDPNTAYITCEVKNGAIVQWKTYCNGIPLTSNDFKKAYQAHIQQACFDGKEKN